MPPTAASHSTGSSIAPADVRMTPARKEIYDVLMESKDHPTATDVFIRSQARVPGISLATVYNTLETLTHSGLIKQVNLERAPSRFCANKHDHVHFHCDACGAITDADVQEEVDPRNHWKLPRGAKVSRIDVTLRGLCPGCAKTH
jgi:Fur family peroxide stress response transcriptional regulator